MKNIVHIVGTGTIGEPLIGLFTDFKQHLGIDEVTFHKRTPMKTERAKVNHLMKRGALLATEDDKVADFEVARPQDLVHGAGSARARDGRPRLHARRQRQQGAVLQAPQGTRGLPRAGLRVRLREDVRARDQRLGARPGRGQVPADRLVQHAQPRDPHQDARDGRRRQAHDGARAVRLHAPLERHLPDEGLLPRADVLASTTTTSSGRTTRTTSSTSTRRCTSKPKVFSSALKLNTQYMHSVWFNFELKEKTDKKARPRAAEGEPARRAHGAQERERGLLVRPRPRLLRPDPLADRHLDADARRRGRGTRDRRLLLHAAGRQLPPLVRRGRDLAHGPRARLHAHPGPQALRVHGDLERKRKRRFS